MRRTSEAFSVMKTPFPTPGCSSESSQEGSPRSLRGDCWAVAISLALRNGARTAQKEFAPQSRVRQAVLPFLPWVVCVFFFFLFYPSNNLILFSDLSSTARPSPTRSIYAI